MCRATAGPLLAMMGVAGTMGGVALAIVRGRIDRRSDARAMKRAAEKSASATDDLADNDKPVSSEDNA